MCIYFVYFLFAYLLTACFWRNKDVYKTSSYARRQKLAWLVSDVLLYRAGNDRAGLFDKEIQRKCQRRRDRQTDRQTHRHGADGRVGLLSQNVTYVIRHARSNRRVGLDDDNLLQFDRRVGRRAGDSQVGAGRWITELADCDLLQLFLRAPLLRYRNMNLFSQVW